MTQALTLNIDLRQMILAIETAVSLVGMNDTNHGKRVGYIAVQIGNELNFSEQELQFIFELGLLHDCGVSTEQMHSNLVNHFDWDGASVHCDIGYRLLKDFEPLSKFATPIHYHHTSWDELVKIDISAYDARMANLIHLADRIDVLSNAHYEVDILLAKKEIVEFIDECKGCHFDPDLVEAFLSIERSEAFWIALEDRHITRYTWDMGKIPSQQVLTLKELKQLSLILSYIVDQKSPFTAQHSVRVADVAKFLAHTHGLSQEQCEKIEVAGLLHDLGKLHTPDHILEKPGPLNVTERAIMDQHSYETYEILRQINGLEDVALWAAFHHEGINGTGYPFHPRELELTIEARIIAVADIFQALVQDRPYRAGMPIDAAISIIKGLVDDGVLEKDIVTIINQHATECYEIAMGKDPNNNQAYISHLLHQ